MISDQCLLTISVSNRMWFCTYSDFKGVSWLSVFCLLCIFLLERCKPFSVSQNFFHTPWSNDFLNAFCFLRMFWCHNPELPLCCQLLLSIVAALVAGSCSNEWFSLPIRLGWCQRYLWPDRGTCVIAKRYSRGCWESSSITASLGSLLASQVGMICPKTLWSTFIMAPVLQLCKGASLVYLNSSLGWKL